MELRNELAEALLVLVPKGSKLDTIKGFRPCNVCVKLVNKVISNRIKLILIKILSPNQSSFISGRHSRGNVIICQEILHMPRYTKAKKAGIILKLDMEKAYDMMEWGFIEETLCDVNLLPSLVTMIMSLIRKSTCRLIWNGEATESIKPLRGLRQGDPLSPYLFVLFLERLSHWINKKVEDGV